MRHLRPPRMNPAIDLAPYRGKSAEQLVALVKKHRKTVGAVKELERGRKLLAKHGYTTDMRIGSGQAATVYTLTDYPKYVAKITHDPLDAAVMAEVQVLGIRPGLPDVVGVADLGNGLYGIIIERLLPLTKAEDALVETLGEQTAFGREADATVWRYYAKKPRQYELLEAAKTVRDLGFTPTDIGAGNVMKRADGSWVVSDLGFSKPSATVKTRDIKRLSNPRSAHPLRRNPVPAHIRSTRRNPITDLREFDASGGYDDVQQAVFRYAPEVEWYRDEFDAIDKYAISILEKEGMSVGRKALGRGAMARVYPLVGDPDWVVKITTDPTDAALMAEAQFAGSLRGTPGIPKVASVFDLGPSPVRPDKFPGHIYAIVVERMKPLDRHDTLEARALAAKYQRGWLADPATVAKRLEGAFTGSVEEAWLRGVAFVYAMGFRPTDLHAANIMERRDGSYAFSDFGVSGVQGRTASRDIPSLDGSSLTQRPRTKAPKRTPSPAAGIATRPVKRNPMTLAENVALLQTQYDKALARMERTPALREDEDYVEFVEDIRRKLEASKRFTRETTDQTDGDEAQMHAEAFVRILVEVGGPTQLRVWQREGVGTRIYFPSELGYLSVSRDGTVRDIERGRQTLAVTGLYPAWRRAYREALRLYTQARAEALARSED